MILTSELERDFDRLAAYVNHETAHDCRVGVTDLECSCEIGAALSRLRSELEAARESNDRLQGKWDEAGDRCPQCGTGVKASPYVKALEQELREARELLTLKENGAAIMAQVYREALERIANGTLNVMPPHYEDVLNAPDIARRALEEK